MVNAGHRNHTTCAYICTTRCASYTSVMQLCSFFWYNHISVKILLLSIMICKPRFVVFLYRPSLTHDVHMGYCCHVLFYSETVLPFESPGPEFSWSPFSYSVSITVPVSPANSVSSSFSSISFSSVTSVYVIVVRGTLRGQYFF